MRRHVFGLFAITLAVGFNAFTVKRTEPPRQSVRYAIYNLPTMAGETVGANYSIQTTQPGLSCTGQGVVCWFRFTDMNSDGLFTSADVSARADQLDTDNDNIVSDNQPDNQAGIYNEHQGH